MGLPREFQKWHATDQQGGKNALKSSFGFWGGNWKWAGTKTNLEVVAPLNYSLSGKNALLDLSIYGVVKKTSVHEFEWKLNLLAHKNSEDIIGGGMIFKFDLSAFGSEMGEPTILANRNGWSWGRKNGSRVEMRFEPTPADIYLRNKSRELRVYFYKDRIPKGAQLSRINLSLSNEFKIQQTTQERYDLLNSENWPVDSLDSSSVPTDLSFLNASEKPAGKRGFVRADGDRLVFADGTRARFWGTNLTAYSLFRTADDQICKQAKSLSALGFNIVRLHHHDSPWVNPNIFGNRTLVTSSKKISKESLDRLDRWIKCLKDEGIYIWLDLHVERAFKEDDYIDSFEEIRKDKDIASLKGYNYVNRSIVEAMKRFNEAYVTHINPYTGAAYKDEPAIAAMLITNENDLTKHFGNALLPDKSVPEHSRLYMKAASTFAHEQGLPKKQVWQSWKNGVSKLFLNELEHRFNIEIIQHLRKLGVKVPIVTTSTWGRNPLSSLPALTDGDIIDVHAYGADNSLERNPLVADNLVSWMSAGQVSGKPMSVTEWNVSPFPAANRHTLPMYIASSAAHQGWDAMMLYAYSQEPLGKKGKPSNWHAYNDPSLIATLPAAALSYRQGHVKEAHVTRVFTPSREQLFYEGISPALSPALRTAAESSRLLIALPRVKELPWLKETPIPDEAKTFTDSLKPFVDSDATEIQSRTGELVRNWATGIYTINSPRSQAAAGWLGNKTIKLDDIEVALRTRSATIAVQSLDSTPIRKSKNLMISLGSVAVPSKKNRLPYRSKPIAGVLKIRAAAGLKLYQFGPTQKMEKIPVNFVEGAYLINLDGSVQTHWLFLQ